MSCSLVVEKTDDDESEVEDCEFMMDLNNDVKSGNPSCLLSLLELSTREVDDDDGVAGAVTLATSLLIWRFTWRGK